MYAVAQRFWVHERTIAVWLLPGRTAETVECKGSMRVDLHELIKRNDRNAIGANLRKLIQNH